MSYVFKISVCMLYVFIYMFVFTVCVMNFTNSAHQTQSKHTAHSSTQSVVGSDRNRAKQIIADSYEIPICRPLAARFAPRRAPPTHPGAFGPAHVGQRFFSFSVFLLFFFFLFLFSFSFLVFIFCSEFVFLFKFEKCSHFEFYLNFEKSSYFDFCSNL
jgi:hypothetical protein